MSKVVCESCESIFQYNAVKDMQHCPVCGVPLFEDSAETESVDFEDGSLMYFDEMMIFEKKPEYSGVIIYCSECGKDIILDLDKFDELIDKKYVKLKKDFTLTCKGCGKEQKPRKVPYKRKDRYAPPLPHCPVCGSVMLKKIKASSKFFAAATLGAFAAPYTSKTYECKNCGHIF